MSYKKYALIRDSKGLTDYSVSKQSGVARATLSAWKAGKYEPKTDKLARIASALQCDVSELIEPLQIDLVINDKESGEASVVSLESSAIKASQLQRLMAYASKLSNRDRALVLDMASRMAADQDTEVTLTGIHAAEAFEELKNKGKG